MSLLQGAPLVIFLFNFFLFILFFINNIPLEGTLAVDATSSPVSPIPKGTEAIKRLEAKYFPHSFSFCQNYFTLNLIYTKKINTEILCERLQKTLHIHTVKGKCREYLFRDSGINVLSL